MQLPFALLTKTIPLQFFIFIIILERKCAVICLKSPSKAVLMHIENRPSMLHSNHPHFFLSCSFLKSNVNTITVASSENRKHNTMTVHVICKFQL